MTDVEIAIAAAAAGADIVRGRFGTRLDRIDKGAGDFATNADIEAEDAIVALLRRERPQDDILGEETGASRAGTGERTWYVDPLCGTLNYAARMRVAAVNVALRARGRFVAAAVADPFNGEVFFTDTKAAFVRVAGEDRRLAPDASCRLVDLNCDPPFPNAASFKAARLISDPDFESRFRPRVVSSSMALAWVASGQRAAYVTDGDPRGSVHYAAGVALCEGAGCVVSDLRGQPWGGGATGLVASADAETHAALMALVGKHLR